MKKVIIWIFAVVIVMSLTVLGIGCKEPETVTETITETVTETVT